ncbi:MAG: LysR family transcriptional regulator, partial [Aestuariivirga sp.]|nr:LysR family transcriptional regulator [Aestuariivirga sp.]
MLRFTLRQLEHALAIAELGSLAKAAQHLGVAQPSLSASLQKLEAQLGLQLFIRHHAQGVTPSPQGLRFLNEARSLVAHGNDFQRDSTVAGMLVEGEITIGSFSTIAPVYAPKLIAEFQKRYPKTRIKLEEGAQEHLITGLHSGRFDIVLLYRLDMPDDLKVIELARLKPYVLLNANHALARKKQVSLHDLAEDQLILLDVLPSRTYFTRMLENEGITPKISFASPSLELVRGLVGQGLGYSLLITRPHGDATYDGEPLAIRPLVEEVEDGVIAIAALKSLRPTRLISTFEEFCVNFFKKIHPKRS